MSKAIKYYYDFLSQPSRALWIGMKMSKTPFEDCPVALRKRKNNNKLIIKPAYEIFGKCVFQRSS